MHCKTKMFHCIFMDALTANSILLDTIRVVLSFCKGACSVHKTFDTLVEVIRVHVGVTGAMFSLSKNLNCWNRTTALHSCLYIMPLLYLLTYNGYNISKQQLWLWVFTIICITFLNMWVLWDTFSRLQLRCMFLQYTKVLYCLNFLQYGSQ